MQKVWLAFESVDGSDSLVGVFASSDSAVPSKEMRLSEFSREGYEVFNSGMTLRDYFAARAMQAVICEPEKHSVTNEDQLARFAYQTADAMLKARQS